jgi:periplasmic divalent cation tolerance protein
MEHQDDPVLVYVTTSGMDEARRIASALLVHRLIACANILPKMESVYRWNGKVQQDAEVVLMMKSVRGRVADINERVNELHSYDLPCVVALPLVEGSRAFLDWIRSEVQPSQAEQSGGPAFKNGVD